MTRLLKLVCILALAAAGCGNNVDHDSAVKVMSSEAKAEALESYMIQRLNTPAMRTIAMPDNPL